MPIPTCQKRSFLSQAVLMPELLKNLVPQTLGKTAFDFVTFLAGAKERTFVHSAASYNKGSKRSLTTKSAIAALNRSFICTTR